MSDSYMVAKTSAPAQPPQTAARSPPLAHKGTKRQGVFLGSDHDVWLDIATETEGIKTAKEPRDQRSTARALGVEFSPVDWDLAPLGRREGTDSGLVRLESVGENSGVVVGKSDDLGVLEASVLPSQISGISPRSQSPVSWHGAQVSTTHPDQSSPSSQQLAVEASIAQAIFYDEVARHAFLNDEPYVVNTLKDGHVILAAPMSLPRPLKREIAREEDTPYKRKQRRAYEQGKRHLRKANPSRDITKRLLDEQSEEPFGYQMPSAGSATYLDLYERDSLINGGKDSMSKTARFLTSSMKRVRSKELNSKGVHSNGGRQSLTRTMSADGSGTYWLKSEKRWVTDQLVGPEELYQWVPRWQMPNSKIDANVPIEGQTLIEVSKRQGPLPKRGSGRPQLSKGWRSKIRPQTMVQSASTVKELPQRPSTSGVDQRLEESKSRRSVLSLARRPLDASVSVAGTVIQRKPMPAPVLDHQTHTRRIWNPSRSGAIERPFNFRAGLSPLDLLKMSAMGSRAQVDSTSPLPVVSTSRPSGVRWPFADESIEKPWDDWHEMQEHVHDECSISATGSPTQLYETEGVPEVKPSTARKTNLATVTEHAGVRARSFAAVVVETVQVDSLPLPDMSSSQETAMRRLLGVETVDAMDTESMLSQTVLPTPITPQRRSSRKGTRKLTVGAPSSAKSPRVESSPTNAGRSFNVSRSVRPLRRRSPPPATS